MIGAGSVVGGDVSIGNDSAVRLRSWVGLDVPDNHKLHLLVKENSRAICYGGYTDIC